MAWSKKYYRSKYYRKYRRWYRKKLYTSNYITNYRKAHLEIYGKIFFPNTSGPVKFYPIYTPEEPITATDFYTFICKNPGNLSVLNQYKQWKVTGVSYLFNVLKSPDENTLTPLIVMDFWEHDSDATVTFTNLTNDNKCVMVPNHGNMRYYKTYSTPFMSSPEWLANSRQVCIISSNNSTMQAEVIVTCKVVVYVTLKGPNN